MIQACYKHPLKEAHGISNVAILQHFEISRQAHHQQLRKLRQREGEEAVTLELVRAVRHYHPRMGTRKLLAKIHPQRVDQGALFGFGELWGV